jgi:uncharacterized RDD family membrane protein YckC
MALDQMPAATAAPATHPLVRVLVVAALMVAALLALTALVGVAGSGPSLDIAPDPAGVLQF